MDRLIKFFKSWFSISPVVFLGLSVLLFSCDRKEDSSAATAKQKPEKTDADRRETSFSKEIAAEEMADKLSQWPCRSHEMCPENAVCNLVSGRCIWTHIRLSGEPYLHRAFPLSAAPGDFVTLDIGGNWFDYTGIQLFTGAQENDLSPQGPQPHINAVFGNTMISFSKVLECDPTRMIIETIPGASGPVSLYWNDKSKFIQSPITVNLDQKPGEMNACENFNPPAPRKIGLQAFESGPYGVGYVDYHRDTQILRIYYPAVCSGTRTPPAKGKFPIVMILRGSGLVFLNYTYLAGHLASWGYFVIAPRNARTDGLRQSLYTALAEPQTWWAPLNGLTSPQVALIGHSNGAYFAEELARSFHNPQADAGISAVVYLSPAAPDSSVYKIQTPSLIIGGDKDGQVLAEHSKIWWNMQNAPKIFILIRGGNHSQFTDARHWEVNENWDHRTVLSRSQQFMIVQSFTLYFLQKTLGPREFFPNWLQENPFENDIDLEMKLE